MVALVQPLEGLHVAGRKGRHQRHVVGVGVHRSWCRVVVHRMQSAMWKRLGSSRTSVERTSGVNGVKRLSANASEAGAYDRRVSGWLHGIAWSRRCAGIAALVCSAVLAACGGGVFIGVELGDSGDEDPSVGLSAAVSEAPAGAT